MFEIRKTMAALLVPAALLAFASCGNTPEAPAETSALTEAAPVTSSPETTAAITTEAAPATTEAVTEPSYENGDPIVVVTKWHLGYVGSAAHSSQAYTLAAGGSQYSYTDVIEIPLAGTRITFTDDNTNSGGDANYASTNAFVISSWTKKGNSWLIDREGSNYAGAAGGNTEIAVNNGSSMTYSYVTSKDNECIRLSFRSGQTAAFTPPAYPEIIMQYTGERGTAQKSDDGAAEFAKYIEGLKASAKYPSLKGITMYAIGDSYFAGNGLNKDYVWPALLAAEYDMKFINYGINGSTVSAYVTEHNPMVNRYTGMSSESPNIILFEGGKNDFNVSAPIGNDDDKTSATFKGALNLTIEGLQKKYPNALIICISPWKVSGYNDLGKEVGNYAIAMRDVCKARNIPFFFAWDSSLSGVDMTSSAFRTQYCMAANDVSHLNLEGHKYVLPNFEKFIAEQYEAFLKNKQ